MGQKADISDFALIGNGRTAALVHRNGAIAWLCWPRFDSDACFAALLGDERHGHWTITPVEPFESTRKYRDETLVLETEFKTEHSRARLVDFMPVGTADGAIIRRLVCEEGRIAIRHSFSPVFGNGKRAPQWSREHGQMIARSGVDEVRVWCSREDFLTPDARVELSAGDQVTFEMGRRPVKDAVELDRTLHQCEAYWRDWAGQCGYQGPWRDTVIRSLITLKALIHQPTGGMVAAPTTSLPEKLGGSRNWDYRFCWLRDSTMTVLALLHAGYRDEAGAWVQWLLDAIKPETTAAQPVYGLLGNPDLPEYEADWLPGFGGARPVRFGNAACRQFQLDIYGEVLDTVYQWHSLVGSEIETCWTKLRQMLARLETAWRKPDAGFWEQRSDPEFFTQSRAQAWVAFDRAVKSAEQFKFDGPAETWRALRDEAHDQVCKKGFSERLNAFTRAYGSETFDAATLLIPIAGFLPIHDPRITGTLDGIRKHLMRNGFVYRYDNTESDDGIREEEGAFLPCCFWYADCLSLQGRHDEAGELFEKYLRAGNDLGLFAEEFDVLSGTMLGNFPQALTHLALVNTAFNLTGFGPANTRSSTGRKPG
jgi:GH15 family glucan-1,4-alpha-glucosidase